MLIPEQQQPTADMSTLASSPSPWANGAFASIGAHRAQREHPDPYRYELSPQWSATDIQPSEPASTPTSFPPTIIYSYHDYKPAAISVPLRGGPCVDANGWGPAQTAESWERPTLAETSWSYERSPLHTGIPPSPPIQIPAPEVNDPLKLSPLYTLQETKGIIDSVWAIAVAALQREADTRRQLEALLQAREAPRGHTPILVDRTQVDSKQHGDEGAKESTKVKEHLKTSAGVDETRAPAAREIKVQFDVNSLQGLDYETEATEEDEGRRFVDMVETFEDLMKRFDEERAQAQVVLKDEKAALAEERTKVEQEKAKVDQEKAEIEQKKAKVDQAEENVRSEKKRLAQMKQQIIGRELASALKASVKLQQRLAQDKAPMEEEEEAQSGAEHKMLDAMLSQKMRDIEKHRPSGATWRMSQNVRTSADLFKEDITEAEEVESRDKFKNTMEEKKKAGKEQDAAEAAKNIGKEWQSLRNCFERHEDGELCLAGVRPAFEAFRIRAQARRGKAGVRA